MTTGLVPTPPPKNLLGDISRDEPVVPQFLHLENGQIPLSEITKCLARKNQ